MENGHDDESLPISTQRTRRMASLRNKEGSMGKAVPGKAVLSVRDGYRSRQHVESSRVDG